MNPAVMIAVNAAAAAKARTRILDAFRVHGATAPERARPLGELGLSPQDRSLARCINVGVVRGVDASGRPVVIGDVTARVNGFYLDQVAYVEQRDRPNRPGKQLRLVILVLFLAALLPMLLFLLEK